MFVVAAGNPFDGVKLYGPFEDANDAGDWAEHAIADDWWTIKVKPWSPRSHEVRPDGPETAEGGLIGQEPY